MGAAWWDLAPPPAWPTWLGGHSQTLPQDPSPKEKSPHRDTMRHGGSCYPFLRWRERKSGFHRGNLAQGIGPPPAWLGGLVTSIGRKSLPSRPRLMHLPPPEQPVPPLMTPGTCEPRGEVCCGAQRLETLAPFPAQLPGRWKPNPAESTAGSRPLHLILDFFLC